MMMTASAEQQVGMYDCTSSSVFVFILLIVYEICTVHTVLYIPCAEMLVEDRVSENKY